MHARAAIRLAACCALALLAGCSRWHNVALGPGGRAVTEVRRGTPVELSFAAPRRVQGVARPVARLAGTVERSSRDTLYVRVREAAALGAELRPVERPTVAAVVVDRNVAARLHERSGRLTAMLLAGVAAVVAIVLLAG
jgi:hypothetical protein